MDAGSGRILTTEHLAEYLRIPKSTLYKLAQEGKVPGQKVGRHSAFREKADDRWLERDREDQVERGKR